MRRIFLTILPLLFFLTYIPKVYAVNSQFDISATTEYLIEEDTTSVTQVTTIKNNTEFYYTPTYTVSLGFENIEKVEAYSSDGSIPTTTTKDDSGKTSIKLAFPKRYAGMSQVNEFTLKFSTKDVAKKQGSIWEVTIPGIDKPDDFSTYNIKVKAPDSFGKPSIIKPEVKSPTGTISFTKQQIGKGGVYILFGDKQYYSFLLKYNISNPNLFPVRTEIALPSQTNYQNISLTDFSEDPENVARDEDGNWIAEYKLLPQQKKQISVKGFVELFDTPRKEELTSRQLKEYTAQKKNWDSLNPAVKKEAEKLSTPYEIYDFVVKTLTYNYGKVATENVRLGAAGALKNPRDSVCLEFTDLFIALARAKGIPSRAVEGYAYTQNSKIRPLSLVSDILHAWPEYYDNNEKKWIMVDPTWGNTTRGMDYFSSLDFSHVAFAKKGFDSEYPIPAGGYKFSNDTKDVVVAFAEKKDYMQNEMIVIEDSFPNFHFPKMKMQGNFIIKNSGTLPLVGKRVTVRTSGGTTQEFFLDYIPPKGSKKITTTFADIPFLTNEPYNITIQVDKTIHKKSVRISFIPDTKLLIIIGGLISGSTIIAAITFHTGSILIQRRKRKNSIHR